MGGRAITAPVPVFSPGGSVGRNSLSEGMVSMSGSRIGSSTGMSGSGTAATSGTGSPGASCFAGSSTTTAFGVTQEVANRSGSRTSVGFGKAMGREARETKRFPPPGARGKLGNVSGCGQRRDPDAPGMKIRSAKFVTSASQLDGCPRWEVPEVAFIGRSNVGKSSLINLLTNQKSLAKVSATPGKTRLLNFFLVNETWGLVDLPGYGFAKTAKNEKFDFNLLVGDFLERRENLRRVFVLIDSRHEPQRIDLDFLAWLESTGRAFSLVFTKADKQSPTRTRANAAAFLEAATPWIDPFAETYTTSSTARTGRLELLRAIRETVGIP